MKNYKLIIFTILSMIAILNGLYLTALKKITVYGIGSFLKAYAQAIIPTILIITCLTLISCSYFAQSALVRKNLLRTSLLILIVLLVISITGRIYEMTQSVFFVLCYVNTLIYIMLLLLNISILKDLYTMLQKIFTKRND